MASGVGFFQHGAGNGRSVPMGLGRLTRDEPVARPVVRGIANMSSNPLLDAENQ
jgi:hypothetical protein